MIGYRKDFDETKYMLFLIKDDESLEKYNKIWKKVEHIINKEFDSEPVYNETYLKAKIITYNGKINTKFCSNEIPIEGSQFIYLSVILIIFVFSTDKNYYSQVILEECNYGLKEKKIPKYIIND